VYFGIVDMRYLTTLLLALTVASASERKPVPANGAANAPYSPGLLTGGYLYVSGQLGREPSGAVPPAIEDQARIILNQLKSIVESAGLTMDHVVYTQLFLTDVRNYDAVNKIYAYYFPGAKPARVTVGVARLPFSCGMEISAVAVRDLASRKPVTRPNAQTAIPIVEAITTHDRLFLSGTLGRDLGTGEVPKLPAEQIRTAFNRAQDVLRFAGLTEASLVSVNVFYTQAIQREEIDRVWGKVFGSHVKAPVSYIRVNELALGAKIGITGVAALNVKQARFKNNCASLGETLYCAVEESGMGSIEQQTRDTMARLSRNAAASGFKIEDASATQLYLDSMDDFAKMNAAYLETLPAPRPARVTIQPAPSGESHRLIQAALVVSRSSGSEGKRKAR
jgi:2-iminobutanoate/2-iminopropanoate deaminase